MRWENAHHLASSCQLVARYTLHKPERLGIRNTTQSPRPQFSPLAELGLGVGGLTHSSLPKKQCQLPHADITK